MLMWLENVRGGGERRDMLGNMVRTLDGVCRKFEYVAVGRGSVCGCSCKFGELPFAHDRRVSNNDGE